jgi:hypothetical protein
MNIKNRPRRQSYNRLLICYFVNFICNERILKTLSSIAAREIYFSFRYALQTGYGTHPASYVMNAEVNFLWEEITGTRN